jgi:hypothetical protein
MSDTGSSDTRPYHHGDLRRALIEAALALVTEEQDWAFSLREVARRALPVRPRRSWPAARLT